MMFALAWALWRKFMEQEKLQFYVNLVIALAGYAVGVLSIFGILPAELAVPAMATGAWATKSPGRLLSK